ncbi:MAG: helix-turn-helix domain-containing protein, partial [Thermomicrobiales bacterium]
MAARSVSIAGQELRYWRTQRSLSQLDLALKIGMAPRQISFIETGRARPRQATLLRLAEVLEIPLRNRNTL